MLYFHETDGYKSATIDIAIAGLKAANCEFIHFKHISQSHTCAPHLDHTSLKQ